MAGRQSGASGGVTDRALNAKLLERKFWGRGSITTARHRTYGASAKMGGWITLFGCYRAPAHFDAVQIVLVSPVNHDPANPIKATVMAPARFNDGVNGLDAAGAIITPTPVTWGTTNPRNPRNPGGGAPNTIITGASGAAPNEIEARVISDIIPLSSLNRTDVAGGLPLLMVRVQGADPPGMSTPGLSGVAVGNASLRAVEPDHWCQYANNTDLASATAGVVKTTDDAFARWAPSIEIIYYLRGSRVVTIGCMGDSLDGGWGNVGTANGTAGLMDGWCRKFARQLSALYPVSFVAYQRDGFTGTRFQEEAMNALLDGGVGLTHLFINPSSTNNNWAANPASLTADLRRTGHLIDQCVALGITPILRYHWAGQDIGSAAGIRIREYVDAHKASGGLTFDARKVVSFDGTDTHVSINQAWITRRADNSAVDFQHLNNGGHQAVANAAFAQRGRFNL